MKKTVEMIFIGRGGQGVWTAARIVAEALAKNSDSMNVQVMPEFMAERSGAPTKSYIRFSKSPIYESYKITNKVAYVVVFDASLVDQEKVDALINEEGHLVIDASDWPVSSRHTSVMVDALKIAREEGTFSSNGRPMGNMVVLGALLRVLPEVSIDMLAEIAKKKFGDASANAMRRGYNESRVIAIKSDPTAALIGTSTNLETDESDGVEFQISRHSADENKTGSWSSRKPVFDPTVCTACGICEVYCPDDIIRYENGVMLVDIDYCKGCGICVEVCPHAAKGAIKLVELSK